MTEKVQKIREEVERLKLCTMDEHMKFYSEAAEAEYNALCKVEEIIDSMQEEPVAPKVLEDMFNAKTAAESLGVSQEEHDRIVNELIYGKEPELVDADDLPNKEEERVSYNLEKIVEEIAEPTILNAYGTKELARRLRNTICGTSVSKNFRERYKRIAHSESFKKAYEGISIGDIVPVEGEELVSEQKLSNVERIGKNWKEPVSDDLEEAADKYESEQQENHKDRDNHDFDNYRDGFVDGLTFTYDAFKAGAKWQKQQFEKNRLKHCNSITNEQAELEQGFIDQHIDKYNRMPTFLDAVEYGMRLQKEQMMSKAVDGDITFDYYGDDDKTYGCIAHDSFRLDDFGLKDRDKVKVILIKEG